MHKGILFLWSDIVCVHFSTLLIINHIQEVQTANQSSEQSLRKNSGTPLMADTYGSITDRNQRGGRNTGLVEIIETDMAWTFFVYTITSSEGCQNQLNS